MYLPSAGEGDRPPMPALAALAFILELAVIVSAGSDALSAIVTFSTGVVIGVLIIFAADLYSHRRHGR
jgi:hypothetical protein